MDLFQNEVKEHFLKNYDRLLEFAEKKAKESVFTEPITTGIYHLRVPVDYRLTVARLVGGHT